MRRTALTLGVLCGVALNAAVWHHLYVTGLFPWERHR